MLNITLMILLTCFLGNLSIHFVTPAMPAMMQKFHTTGHWIQLTISLFLIGKAIGVLFFGPLSEKYGRRPCMLSGLLLFTFASLAISQTTSIKVLLCYRFIQGIAVSATVLMGRTMINDYCNATTAVKKFAELFTFSGVIIALLPILGGYLAYYFPWQYAFYAMAIYSAMMTCLLFFFLPETNLKTVNVICFQAVCQDYKMVLKHPLFLAYLFISSLMVAGESLFNTSAAFILIKTAHWSIAHYAKLKTALAVSHLAGSGVCAIAIRYIKVNMAIAIGAFSFLVGSSLMMCFNLLQFNFTIALLLPMTIYYFGTGFITATVSALITRPFPKKMATAMAFCLFLQFIISSIFSALSSLFNIQTSLPLSFMLFFLSSLIVLLWFYILYYPAKTEKLFLVGST